MLLATGVLSAQENISVIKLRSGIEVKGVIIEEIAGETISVKTPEGDVFVYRASEIVRIDRPSQATIKAEERKRELEEKAAQKVAQKENKEKEQAEKKILTKTKREERALGNFKGYRGIVDAFFGGDICDAALLLSKISFINGYNFGPYFYMGIGVGWTMRDGNYIHIMRSDSPNYEYHNSYKSYTIPIFLHLRTSFAKNCRVSPYISLSLGYDLAISNRVFCKNHAYDLDCSWYYDSCGFDCFFEYRKPNGLFVEPAIGIEIRTSRKTAVQVAFTVPMKFGQYIEEIPMGASLGFSF